MDTLSLIQITGTYQTQHVFGLGCIGLSHIRLGIFSIPVFFFYTDPHIAAMQANAKHGG